MSRFVSPPKNSVIITMTIIDEHGNEAIQHHMATTMHEIAMSGMLEYRASDMAKKFRETCAGMGYFDHLMRGEKK